MPNERDLDIGSPSQFQRRVQDKLDEIRENKSQEHSSRILSESLRQRKAKKALLEENDVPQEESMDDEDFDFDLSDIDMEEFVPTEDDYDDNSEVIDLDWSEIQAELEEEDE